ncbi:MAG: GPW/gp25 family protein [Firmicutes bacterium]|nr:GPW/gp25 family protein [Bacillota bacterium]
MATTDFLGKGWGFPINVNNGRIRAAEGEESIKESIRIILGTSKGERVMRPDFGSNLNEMVFAPDDTATATQIKVYVQDALLKWEPRIDVQDVKVTPNPEKPGRLDIEIYYNIKASNSKHNLVYPFYLERAGK